MKYTVKKEVFELNPNLCFGIIVAKNMKNTETQQEDLIRLRTAEEMARNNIKVEELKNQPIIAGYRQVLENAGINPNKFINSMEAMMKRVLKGSQLPAINSMVDICNAISLENQVSLGGHDLSDIKEDLFVGFSKGTERFIPFGAVEYEGVESGELVFCSGEIVQTRKWVWRQSELGKMTLDTKDVFFQLTGFDQNEGSPLVKALESLEEVIKKKYNGTYTRYIVNKTNPEIEFSY